MGGLIASLLAIKYPDLVGRLAVVSPMYYMKAGLPHCVANAVARYVMIISSTSICWQ
jgi:pimeloyl-ACP methyl ester carboxylesterase